MSILSLVFIIFLVSSTGSPADEVDLKVGDEIVEVNGQTLEGATHMEVITYIHKVSRHASDIDD